MRSRFTVEQMIKVLQEAQAGWHRGWKLFFGFERCCESCAHHYRQRPTSRRPLGQSDA